MGVGKKETGSMRRPDTGAELAANGYLGRRILPRLAEMDDRRDDTLR